MPVMSWSLLGDDIYYSRVGKQDYGPYQFFKTSSGHVIQLGRSMQRLVPNAPDVAVSPDGKLLLYAQEDVSSGDLKIRRTLSPNSTTRP